MHSKKTYLFILKVWFCVGPKSNPMTGSYGNEYCTGPIPNTIAMIVGLWTIRIGLLLTLWWSKWDEAGDILNIRYADGYGGESTHELHQSPNQCTGQRYYIYGTCRCWGNGWGSDNIAVLMVAECWRIWKMKKIFFNGIVGSGTSIDASISYFSRSLLIMIHMEGLLCIMRRRFTVLPSF